MVATSNIGLLSTVQHFTSLRAKVTRQAYKSLIKKKKNHLDYFYIDYTEKQYFQYTGLIKYAINLTALISMNLLDILNSVCGPPCIPTS